MKPLSQALLALAAVTPFAASAAVGVDPALPAYRGQASPAPYHDRAFARVAQSARAGAL